MFYILLDKQHFFNIVVLRYYFQGERGAFMTKQKTDPRVIRTRQLLLDSFTSLIQKKDFSDITVRDITEKATVNRATFYAHFTDKFEMLDTIMSETFMTTLRKRVNSEEELSYQTIENIFLSMCEFHKNLSKNCPCGYHSLSTVIEKKIKDDLQKVIYALFLNESTNKIYLKDDKLLQVISTMMSWSIYGAAYTWNNGEYEITAEELASKTMPLIMSGIETLHN